MCEFKKEITDKTQFTGYKIAIKRNGKYYSPITGIEYKPGKVTPAKKLKKVGFNFCNVTDPRNKHHIPSYEGMTAIFKDPEKNYLWFTFSARQNSLKPLEKGTIVILKMTIQKTKTKNCWIGFYANDSVYIGPKIRSIKEIE